MRAQHTQQLQCAYGWAITEKGGTGGDRERECIQEEGRQADRHKQNQGVVPAVEVVL